MQNRDKDVASMVSGAGRSHRDVDALRHSRSDAENKEDGFCDVEQVVCLVRELREAYPDKDVKVRVGDVVVVASEPGVGNKLFALLSGLIHKLVRYTA